MLMNSTINLVLELRRVGFPFETLPIILCKPGNRLRKIFSFWEKIFDRLLLVNWEVQEKIPLTLSNVWFPLMVLRLVTIYTSGLGGTYLEPALRTGRVSAKTPEELDWYLNKLETFESQPPAIWMKNVMHFGGGRM